MYDVVGIFFAFAKVIVKSKSCTIFRLAWYILLSVILYSFVYYPRRARSALGVDTVLTLDVCLYVCMFVCLYVSALERKRLIGMT